MDAQGGQRDTATHGGGMSERERMQQIIQRYREATRLLPEKKSALSKAVECVIKKYNLTSESGMSLLNELSIPPDWVNQREHRIHFGLEVKRRGQLPELSKDVAAMHYTVSKYGLMCRGKRPSDVRWKDLSPNERDAARRMNVRFSTQHNPFHKGKPAYAYGQLVEEYVAIIERAVDRNFIFSRNPYDAEGEPCGAMMEVLMSALDLALPYSGKPPRETVASIVYRKRKSTT